MKKWTLFFITLLLSSMVYASDEKPLIGVAWIDNPTETYNATCQAIEAAGGTPIVLDQVLSTDLEYDRNGMLIDVSDSNGVLSTEAAKLVRCNTWQGSNVEEVIDGISAVVFPGGKDISPSLYYEPKSQKGSEGSCAERDVSDYLLMSYCLEHDIPIFCICRGMQMLSIVSGADMIQDIGMEIKDYAYTHRNEPDKPDAYRDFAFHDVTITDKDSLLYVLTGSDTIHSVPSWHHQAVKNVYGTRLRRSISLQHPVEVV